MVRIRESFRKPGRVSLKLSDGLELVVSLAVAVEFKATRVGAVLSPEAQVALNADSQLVSIVDRALGFMARARRTRLELKARLARLDFEPALVVVALDRLEQSGLLSDASVADAEASSRVRAGESPLRIRQRLRQKGVSDVNARAAVGKAIDDEGYDEGVACRRAAEKRARSLGDLEAAVASRRLTAFLARRGFAAEIVRSTVRDVLSA